MEILSHAGCFFAGLFFGILIMALMIVQKNPDKTEKEIYIYKGEI